MMRMSLNEFFDYTKNMTSTEYAEFIEYASQETEEEPEWLWEYRNMKEDE